MPEKNLKYREHYEQRCAILSFFDVGEQTGRSVTYPV